MTLQTRLRDADRIYKMYASRLEKLGIEKMEDFLLHIPFRYDDFSKISKARFVQVGDTVTIQGKVLEIKNEFTRNYKKIQTAVIEDESGTIEAVWFNQPFLLKTIHQNDTVSLSGKVGWFLRKKVMQSPDYEILTGDNQPIHTARLVPIYSETAGVSSKWLRRQVYKLLNENQEELVDSLPNTLIKEEKFIDLKTSLSNIHFPKYIEDAENARKRLAYEELFLMQLTGLKKRKEWEENIKGHTFEIEKYKLQIEKFWESLPFELTNAQKRAVHEIFSDVSRKQPMNRLLEGDVGSGKTIVAAIAIFLAHLNGFQSVLMAPTEILAQQHFQTLINFLKPAGMAIELVTGSKKIKENNFDVLVGTHAVLSKNISFEKLGLVVIDEQQRFGVEQRTIIREKGTNPHLLTMTATPIPRTVALTMYGDLDLSYLDEMPKGRRIIKTWLVPKEKKESGHQWIQKQIENEGTQAFIVCPFIEPSESMITIKAAKEEFENLRKNVFKTLRLGLLHGRLKSKEKNDILEKFRNKKIDILIATPVVEVGIDFPNATIIVIEDADRFGLAQLHQLRGRVGRGDKQSYCLLFTQSVNPLTIERLKGMEKIFVGAELAELDLKLRGPGELFGTKQHGAPDLKIARFSDSLLIEKTKKAAQKIFPEIKKYPSLLEKLEKATIMNVSPD